MIQGAYRGLEDDKRLGVRTLPTYVLLLPLPPLLLVVALLLVSYQIKNHNLGFQYIYYKTDLLLAKYY